MPWQCRLVENPFQNGGLDRNPPQIGDMWFDPWKISDDCPPAFQADLSDEYRRDWLGKRPPLIVVVPGQSQKGYRLIPIDEHYTRPGETHGWTVTGEAPISPVLQASMQSEIITAGYRMASSVTMLRGASFRR